MGIFALANVVMFWPMYFKGLIPFPGDLLVSFFFPWKDGGFFGYNPWTTHKEYLAADAIRQMFVWKSLGFNLWNPYNFAGSFLFANLQSSFLSISSIVGWVPSVVVVMSLFGFFTYLFLKDLKISPPAAILGGLAAANISYLTGWQEILVNCQSALFLPVILLGINRKKYFFSSLFLALSIFGGHIQTTVYVYIIVLLYSFYKKVPFLNTFFMILASIGLGAVQLVPTIEAYFYSARETAANADLIARTLFPLKGLITFFASDFFGNTANFNLQLFNYADARSYIGLVPAIFSLYSLYRFKEPVVRFFWILALVGLLFSVWPLGLIFNILHIPVLSSVVPARMIMVFLFAAAVLSAYGFEYVLKNKLKFKPLIFVGVVFLGLWGYVLINKTPETIVSRNNLIIPSVVFFMLCVLIVMIKKVPKLLFLIFIVAILEPGYYFVKHQPFADPKFVFPDHPVFTFLKNKAGYDRFMGFGAAYLDNNFATYYHLYSPEGYDPLYIKRYGELIYDRLKNIPRSDAKLSEKDDDKRNQLMDILGVKYVLEKVDDPKDEPTPDFSKFPADKYKLVWQVQKWQAYERLSVLPRTFVANYLVEPDPQKILDMIYDPDFDPGNKIIVEKSPGNQPFYCLKSPSEAKIISYEPSRVEITASTDCPKMLFLSDNYYPGWKAYVDGKETTLYRADYSFRAVPLTPGSHNVVFLYDPWSFKIGLLISGLTLITILLKSLKRRAANS